MYTSNRNTRRGASSNRRTFTPSRGPRNSSRGNRSFSRNSGGRKKGGKGLNSFNPSQFINKNPVAAAEVAFAPKHTFKTFGLTEALAANVEASGVSTPTPIQDKIIPEILQGNDVIGLAETGTGKTAAFLLPLIERTLKDKNQETIILAPTRELAIQIEEELRKFAAGFHMHSTICVGGTPIGPQIRSLKRKNHFIIGTPGRVLDLINRGCLNTRTIHNVVLDEADRMLDMGFIHDMRAILENVPKSRSTLFFSATMNRDAEAITKDFLRNPVVVSVKKKDVAESVLQDVVPYESVHKYDTLLTLLAKQEFARVLIFGAMKHSVEKLAKELTKSGIKAESIHGNKSHGARQQALKRFKSGNARVLVATDVAARGIHVDKVTHVINYDLPNTFEDYVHRIGRTGRGAHKGIALTFIPKTALSR